jgi:prepilin-type N-terminal cleavage/methylation domain-containing protein
MEKMHLCKRKDGFTLIEIIIVTSIFVLIAMGLYSAFYTGVLSYSKADSAFKIYQTGAAILDNLENDLKNSFIYSKKNSGFKGDSKSLEFFTLLDSYNARRGMSKIVSLISYNFKDNILQRVCLQNASLLEDHGNEPSKAVLFEAMDVIFDYAYRDDMTNEPYEWRASCEGAPLAVRIKLFLPHIDKWGKEADLVEFSRIVSLPLKQ